MNKNTSNSDTLHWNNIFYNLLWHVSLLLLLLNDHYFKYNFLFPDWIRHKLSDFMGLIVFPPLVCFFLGIKNRKASLAIFATVGFCFLLINLSDMFSQLSVNFLSAIGIPARMRPDITDLIALVTLPLTWKYFSLMGSRYPKHQYSLLNKRVLPALALAICLSTAAPREYETLPLRLSNTTGLAYTANQFRDGLSLDENTLMFADPDRHRIVQMKWDSDEKSLSFDRALLYRNSGFVQSQTNIAGEPSATGFQYPIDIAQLSGQSQILWILDQNSLRSFDREQNRIVATISLAAGEEIIQIEASDELIVLSQKEELNQLVFRLYFYDENGTQIIAANKPYLIPNTQPESGREMEDIIHFKTLEDKVFLLKKLEIAYPDEATPYFLESLDINTLDFQSGVFLHDAFGMSVTEEDLWVSARQRNFKDKPTIFNLSLDRRTAFQFEDNAAIQGIIFPLEINSEENEYYSFFLNFAGEAKVYEISPFVERQPQSGTR